MSEPYSDSINDDFVNGKDTQAGWAGIGQKNEDAHSFFRHTEERLRSHLSQSFYPHIKESWSLIQSLAGAELRYFEVESLPLKKSIKRAGMVMLATVGAAIFILTFLGAASASVLTAELPMIKSGYFILLAVIISAMVIGYLFVLCNQLIAHVKYELNNFLKFEGKSDE